MDAVGFGQQLVCQAAEQGNFDVAAAFAALIVLSKFRTAPAISIDELVMACTPLGIAVRSFSSDVFDAICPTPPHHSQPRCANSVKKYNA